MFSLDLSAELITMVITAAGVLLLLFNMTTTLTLGLLLILMVQTWCCVKALCE